MSLRRLAFLVTPVRKKRCVAAAISRPLEAGHVASGESLSAERLCYAGDVAPPTRIPCHARAKETLPGGVHKSPVSCWSRSIRGISVGGATVLRG
ncbi:MAG: hypothetical protein WKF77_24665 [Planctomycetaceae bacterium]